MNMHLIINKKISSYFLVFSQHEERHELQIVLSTSQHETISLQAAERRIVTTNN